MTNYKIDNIFSEYINSMIEFYIVNDDKDLKERINAFWELYDLLLQDLTKDEKQLFSNTYTRSVFVLDYYNIDNQLKRQLNRIWFIVKEINKNNIKASNEDYIFIVCSICEFIKLFSDLELPEIANKFLNKYSIKFEVKKITKEIILLLDVVVQEIGEMKSFNEQKYFVLSCKSDELGDLKIKIWNDLADLRGFIWKYVRVIFTDLELDKQQVNENELIYNTNSSDTLITIDPDFLFDASSLAACFTDHGANPLLYILNNYLSIDPNYYIFRGNVVNSYLDSCFEGKQETIKSIFYKSIEKQPLLALNFDIATLLKLQTELPIHFNTIDNIAKLYQNNNNSLEPTFISEIFGIRGRLDLLVEYPQEVKRKDVIELKTSKDPRPYGREIYEKDHIQATCYNLLLESIDRNRLGSSAILYSSLATNFLRDSTNDKKIKRQTLKLRNQVSAYLYFMTKAPKKILERIKAENLTGLGLFPNTISDINNFASKIQNLSDLEQDYFLEFSKFVAKEHRAEMIGCVNERGSDGFSSLWNKTLYEKEKTYKILAFLEFEEQDNNTFCFTKSKKTSNVSTFRKGDFVLLYPQEGNGEVLPTKHQILKGVVYENSSKIVKIKPFNKFINTQYFEKHLYWCIEPELFELGFKLMYESLYNFINFTQTKKDLLLGIQKPIFEPINVNLPEYLKPKQKEIVKKAISSKNYFLIQGPPGTGKTKVILKEIIIQLLKNPYEKIILLAFTNKAVDEICESIKSIKSEFHIFRLGHEESTTHDDLLLSNFAKNKQPEEIKKAILECRIFISTVLTFLRSSELYKKIKFTTAIIDEASQLLEPQLIGVLGNVERFILIGDEKQLSAVVVQSEDDTNTESKNLNEIGILNLRNSIFERLLRNCKSKGWHDSYDILTEQRRMHIQIQDFPSTFFYENKLQPIDISQSNTQINLFGVNQNDLTKLIAGSRILFIPSKSQMIGNINTNESELVALFINKLKSLYNGNFTIDTLGVITPYRAQIGEIRQKLTDELNELITIDTVERYQGGQKKIILISLAVNNTFQLKNLSNIHTFDNVEVDRKLNVALTRAQELLIVFGCPEILNQSPMYAKLIKYYQEKGYYIKYND